MFSEYADDPDLAPLADEFVSTLPADIDGMRAALSAGDRDMLARIAHKLRGIGGSVGFAPITKAAGNLEDRVRRQLGGVEPALDALVATCLSARPGRAG